MLSVPGDAFVDEVVPALLAVAEAALELKTRRVDDPVGDVSYWTVQGPSYKALLDALDALTQSPVMS